MGWTGIYATCYKNGKVDRKAEVEKSVTYADGFSVVKSVLVGTTVYQAVKNEETGDIFAMVILTKTQKRSEIYYIDFWYKEMDETEGPYYYDCPESILKLLTPTDNENALNWRTICWNKQEQKKAEKNDPYALKNLPIGSVIEFMDGDRKIRLVKHSAAYQFKRPFWMVDGDCKYMPAKYIPDNYTVIA